MNNTKHLLRRFALLLGFAVLGTGANAGNIRGAWDPQFQTTGTYSGTGFLGEIVFSVPNVACLTGTPGGSAYFLDGGACGDMSFLSAQVGFYNWPNTTPVISTINFGVPVIDPILGIEVSYSSTGVGTVVGLDTLPIGPEPHVGSPSTPSPLYLQFWSGQHNFDSFFPFLTAGVRLLPQLCDGDVCGPDYTQTTLSIAGVGDVTFTPEPGTIALLLGGLGATFLARRRKVAA